MGDMDWTDLMEECFTALADGAADRRHGFHLGAISTVGLDGRPAARMAVLRGVHRETRILAFHTDRRSRKVAEIERDPRMGALFYDAEKGIQIRIDGIAHPHWQDDVAKRAFAAATLFARRCYLAEAGPGAPLAEPGSGLPAALVDRAPTEVEAANGFANFCVIHLRIDRLDWLSLAARGHRRATLRWSDDGDVSGRWVVP